MRNATPTPSRPMATRVTSVSNKCPPPTAEGKADPTMSEYLRSQFDVLIERFATTMQGMEGHCDRLMGQMPSDPSPASEVTGASIFSELESKLHILQHQAAWLESIAQRVYRI